MNASVDNDGKSVSVVEHFRFAGHYLLELVETVRFIAPVDRLSLSLTCLRDALSVLWIFSHLSCGYGGPSCPRDALSALLI